MSLQVSHARIHARDVPSAVDELRRQLGPEPLDAVLFFCAPDYDLAALGMALDAAFDNPVAGCTSSGQIGLDGFEHCGLLAIGLRGGVLKMHPFLIEPLSELEARAATVAESVQALTQDTRFARSFGLLLVDGLSAREEYLAAALYQMFGNVPLIGGSAGDNLRFEQTHVYCEGHFRRDAAVLVLMRTSLPFVTFKAQHFEASAQELVITAADPHHRVISEINGEPAVDAYAEAIGLDVDELDAAVFAMHPLLLTISGEPYVRSIQRVNPDGSLSCYCAVAEGRVVSIGRALDPVRTFEQAFEDVHRAIGEPTLVLGCDCILRRIEFEQHGQLGQIGRFMAAQHVFGFSTYGEQFNGLHVNQTFTGVAIGG